MLFFRRIPSWQFLQLNMVVYIRIDRLALVSELFCTLYALSTFVAISSLDASVRSFDISSTRTFFVLDQEFSLTWCLMFLKIRVFLKDLFFNSSISLSSSLIVSFCLLFCSFWSLIWNFKPSVSSLFLPVLILDSSVSFSILSNFK